MAEWFKINFSRSFELYFIAYGIHSVLTKTYMAMRYLISRTNPQIRNFKGEIEEYITYGYIRIHYNSLHYYQLNIRLKRV